MGETLEADRQAPRPSVAGLDPAQVIDAVPIGICVLDHDLRYRWCNAALAELNGIPVEHHIGRTVAELLPELLPQIEAGFREVLDGRVAGCERKVSGETPRHPGLVRTWLERVSPLFGPDGRILAIVVAVEEITALEKAEAQLRESERTYRASQQLSADGFCILRSVLGEGGAVLDFVVEYANPAAQRLLSVEQLVGRRLLEAYPASAYHDALFPRFGRLLGTAVPDEAEVHYDDGTLSGWFRVSVVAIDPERLAVSFRDISPRKRSEEQLRLVTREFRHRMKNLLAVVGALITQTAKHAEDAGELTAALQRRLASFSAAQDLLIADFEGEVSLAEIVAAATDPFEASVEIGGGPAVRISSAYVVPLTLALNELATNAVKYGSAASPAACVGWSEEDGRITLRWSETGSVAEAASGRKGFGSRLLELAARGLPRGALRVDRDQGLRIELAFDASTR